MSPVPYLTTAGSSLLRDNGVDTLADLAEFLKRADAPSALSTVVYPASAPFIGMRTLAGYAHDSGMLGHDERAVNRIVLRAVPRIVERVNISE